MPVQWKHSRLIAVIALMAVTAVWGYTFVIVKDAISQFPVMHFLWIRFFLAALVMIILRPLCLRHFTWRGVLHGIILGVFLGGGYITQTFGLQWTFATVSGFITGMSVVFTPVLSWIFMHDKPNRYVWLAVILASIGLAFLGLRGWVIGIGEFLTLLGALSFAIHIVSLGKWANRHDVYGLAFIQVLTVAVISFIASVPQGIIIPQDTGVWIAIGITALFATAVAFVIQTWTQSIIPPFHAAIVLTTEPVFAGLFGITIGGDSLTWQIITGAVFILGAMVLVQLTQNHDRQPTHSGTQP